MYLNETNNHLINLPPNLSMLDLPKPVIDFVVCFGSEFNLDNYKQSTLYVVIL